MLANRFSVLLQSAFNEQCDILENRTLLFSFPVCAVNN